MVALICAWLFGAAAMQEGCAGIDFYKENRSDLVASTTNLQAREGHEQEFSQIIERYYAARDSAKDRLFPLAAAALLLGAATWALAAAAMAGRAGARRLLLQVLVARAAVVVVAYAITPDVRAAELSASADLLPHLKQSIALAVPPEVYDDARRYAHVFPAILLSLQLTGYGLVLLALTRRRVREFFDGGDGTARAET